MLVGSEGPDRDIGDVLCFLFFIFCGVFGDGAKVMVIQRELKFVVMFLAGLAFYCCGVGPFHVLTFEEKNGLVELSVWVVLGV